MQSWRWVTDGGLETDLIFHRGANLPEFAAYPLVWSDEGRAMLRDYYAGYARIAEQTGRGLRLETPTWRANPDWGAAIGHDQTALDDVNARAVALLQDLADEWSDRVREVQIVGTVGPRGDGYVATEGGIDPDEAADYHAAQLASFARAGADAAAVLTLTEPGEAIGVARAAASAGLPVAVGFTVETDGGLPDGTSLGDAVVSVDEAAAPAWYLVNCAHPEHVLSAFADGGDWAGRVHGLRVNASTMSHAELDAAEELDEGDLGVLVPAHRRLEERLPALEVVGGCCGTDARHVAALWGVGS
jgi:S-methylmethionine-dependent homocysteine/selenocysteine methylase